MSKAAGVVPQLPPHVDVKWAFNELTNTGTTGDPTRGTPQKGKRMREVLVEAMVKVLTDLDRTGWEYRSPGAPGGR